LTDGLEGTFYIIYPVIKTFKPAERKESYTLKPHAKRTAAKMAPNMGLEQAGKLNSRKQHEDYFRLFTIERV
jgi:hypothetical protein